MEYSKTKLMDQPQPEWWQSFFKWIETNMIMFLITGSIWKGMALIYKFRSESRDLKMKELAKEVVEEANKPLEAKIDNLTNMFLAQHNKS